MMRSMYAGVSGLRNHQTRMDVIGNNIANVNTAGFKKSRVVFKDMLYQNVRGASNPTGSRGGTNPMGVGLGMALSSIDQIHTGAPATSTGRLTDMAIDGNGYFVVNDGSNRYYTRAGAFDFDIQGNLINADGLRVQGWLANRDTWELNTNGDPTNISIADYKTIEARATTEMKFTGNLDSGLNFKPARDEWQTLTFSEIPHNGGAIDGLFRLSFDGQTTEDIKVGTDATVTAGRILVALENLPNIGTGNIAVTWDDVRQRYDIKFKNVLGATNLPNILAEIGPIKAYNGGEINIDSNDTQNVELSFVDGNHQDGTEGSGFKITLNDGTERFILIGASTDQTAANIKAALEATDIGKTYGVESVIWDDATECYMIKFVSDPGTPVLDSGTAINDLFTGGIATIVPITQGQEPTAVISRNEIQTLDLTNATAGNFTLSYKGEAFNLAIDYDSAAADIQTALEEIPALKGNVTVRQVTAPLTGTRGGSFAIEFNTALAGTNVDQLVFNTTNNCSGSVLTTTQGREVGYPKDAVSGSRDVYDSQGNVVTVHYRFFKYEIEPGTYPGITPVDQPETRWACDFSTDPLFENQAGYLANADFGAVDLATGTKTGGDKVFRVYNIPFDEMGNIADSDLAKFTYNINRQVPPPGAGTANISCTIDLAGLTQRAGDSSAWASHQDGYAEGSLTSYSVGSDGTITGVYDNGERRDLARVAIANFENPSGLQQMGGTLFAVSGNSGDADIGAPMTGGRGKIIPSSLEMSNVDLSEEFTDMIVTQRGFQANSRIITTSDEMLQELVNLKR
jgi:flagellar hook protein FlgE